MENNEEHIEYQFDPNHKVQPDFEHVSNNVIDVFNFFFTDFMKFYNNNSEQQFQEFITKPVHMHGAFLHRLYPDFTHKVLPTLFADTGIIAYQLGMKILKQIKNNECVTPPSAIVEYPPTKPGGQPMVFVFRMFV